MKKECCNIKVTEIEDGFRFEVTGKDVKTNCKIFTDCCKDEKSCEEFMQKCCKAEKE